MNISALRCGALLSRVSKLQSSTCRKGTHLQASSSFTRARINSIHARMASTSLPSAAVVSELDPAVEAIVKAIHATPTKTVVYATGGCVQVMSWLLSVPGASNTILEVSVPYARDSLVDILGKEPEQYCSEETAAQIAEAAYRRAASLSSFSDTIVGIGATCALATVPLKRGEHRAHIACCSSLGTHVLSLTFCKGARSRVGEDDLASRAALKVLAEACEVDTSSFTLPTITTPPPHAAPGAGPDVIKQQKHAREDPIDALLAGRVRCVECGPGGQMVVDAPRRNKVVLPGSFNPLHEGHRKLLDVAVARYGQGMEGCFELSVGNADKGMLPAEEVRRRLTQFQAAGLPLILTSAPLFTNKAAIMKNCKFVVGYDTAYRMVMPKYYNDSHTQMLLDFAGLRAAGCSFIVAGRRDEGGAFKTRGDIDVPPELADLFPAGLSESDFREDISSTELRKRMQQQQQQQQ